MNHKKFTEGKTEMEYDGNIHLNDPNWDIIKKYRYIFRSAFCGGNVREILIPLTT